MTLGSFLILLLIAALCGALGQALAGFSRGGCLVSTAVGFIGAMIGSWLARQTGLPAFFVVTVGGEPFPVVWAVIGSALFSLALGLLSRRRPY